MRKTLKVILLQTVLSFLAAAFLSGCNTARGLGQDMQEGGKAIQKAANDQRS